MNWILIYRLISGPIYKRFTSNRRFTADELPTWVEQSQDLMLRSTVSFLIVTYSGTFLSFILQLHFSLPTFIPRHLRFACWVSVCNWHSLKTNYMYYGTTFGGVPRWQWLKWRNPNDYHKQNHISTTRSSRKSVILRLVSRTPELFPIFFPVG